MYIDTDYYGRCFMDESKCFTEMLFADNNAIHGLSGHAIHACMDCRWGKAPIHALSSAIHASDCHRSVVCAHYIAKQHIVKNIPIVHSSCLTIIYSIAAT